MRIKTEQLSSQLAQGLKPIYLLAGDEPLQIEESIDAIRAKARAEGYDERIVYDVASGFDWSLLAAAQYSRSLFSERRIVELTIANGKPGREGGKALAEYASNCPQDVLLLIRSGRIDNSSQQSKWFKALDQAGVTLLVWPIEAAQLPFWIEQRMRQKGLNPQREAVKLLAERVEGNLLACSQEIDKLQLLNSGEITPEMVLDSVADSARYDVYALITEALKGNINQVERVIKVLRAEGAAEVLVLWTITQEVRLLSRLAWLVQQGQTIDRVLAQPLDQRGNRWLWDRHKAPRRSALKRHSLERWWQLMLDCAQLERVVKGATQGQPWEGLRALSLAIAGVDFMIGNSQQL